MRPAPRPPWAASSPFLPLVLACALCACTPLVELRLEDGPGVHCDEHNVRLSRELDPTSCEAVPGERFVVTLTEHDPQERALLRFSLTQTPHLVLHELALPVEPGGRVSFTMPDLPVPAGSRIRVQIQGEFVPGAFSGNFEVGWMNLLATLDDDGLVSLWLTGSAPDALPRLYGRIPSGSGDGVDGELVFSPAGRHLVAGAPALPGRGALPDPAPEVGRTLRLLSVFGRRHLANLENTGGIETVAFQASTETAPARVLWIRRDPQTGRWRLVAAELDEDRVGPVVTVREAPDFLVPPRLVSVFGAVVVIPREHLTRWQNSEPELEAGPFWLVSSSLDAQALPCDPALGADFAEKSPLDLIPVDHPEWGRIALISCAGAGLQLEEVPHHEVVARWVRWPSGQPDVNETWPTFGVTTTQLPTNWTLPPRPGPGSVALLRTIPSATTTPRGPLLLDPALEEPVVVDASALGQTGLRALLLDEARVLIFSPETWREGTSGPVTPTLVVGKQGAQGWSFDLHSRDLRHVLSWSEPLLLLANPHNMIQSTLDDFTAGLPGAIFTSSACVHAVLKPSYR